MYGARRDVAAINRSYVAKPGQPIPAALCREMQIHEMNKVSIATATEPKISLDSVRGELGKLRKMSAEKKATPINARTINRNAPSLPSVQRTVWYTTMNVPKRTPPTTGVGF